MKKLIAVAVLSLTGLGLSAGQAPAWFCCHRFCNRCQTNLIVHPYNAFTPICCGSITCTGCCPMAFGSCQPGPACGQGGWCPSACGQGGWCPSYCGPACGDACGPCDFAGSAGCGSCDLGQLPALDGMKGGMAPGYQGPPPPRPPTFNAPMPTPADRPGPVSYMPGTQIGQNGMPNRMVQPAAYQPMYYPGLSAGMPMSNPTAGYVNAFTGTMAP